MLNCLVNSIFHILFCIALAKVLKHVAHSPGSSVCYLCLPLFLFHYHFLPSPLNSPWTDFPCWKFWFCYDRWGIPIHCICIVFGSFSQSTPTLHHHSCKECWIPNHLLSFKNSIFMLKTTLFIYFILYTRLYRITFWCNLDKASSEHLCHCTLFVWFHQALSKYHSICTKWSLLFFLQNSTKWDLQGYLSKLTPTPLRVTSAARDSHMSLAEWTQMPKINSFLDACLFVYIFTVMCW